MTYTSNAIVDSQSTDEQLRRITKPVNVDNNMSFRTNAMFGFPIRRLDSRFNLGLNLDNQNSTNPLNGVESNIVQRTIAGTFRYEYRYKEIFDLSLKANLNYQTTDYQFNEHANQALFNRTYGSEFNLTFLKNFLFNSSFDYLVYKSQAANTQDVPLLNMSLSFFVLNARRGEVKISVNNMLDKSFGMNQRADLNYFEREEITSLGRYFMLSFTYSLNKLLNPLGGRRPVMMRSFESGSGIR